jgi:hypothetical protein
MDEGWLKLHRKIIRSRVFANPELCQLWIWCLAKASNRERWATIKTGRGTREVHIMPGQFIFGRHVAANELGCTPSSARNRMKKLKTIGKVDIKVDNQYSLVTVVNWGTYNSPLEHSGHQSGQRSNNEVTTRGQREDTDKKVRRKEGKKKESLSTHVDGPDLLEAEKRFVARWNATPGVRKNRGETLTAKRRVSFRVRFAVEQWRDDVKPALAKFPLPCSENGGWKPDMDWILKPDSLTRIIEGTYDWSKNGKPEQGGPCSYDD